MRDTEIERSVPESHLRLFGGDGGVAADELREDAAESLDSEGERSHVEEQHVGHVAGQHAALRKTEV